MSTAPAQQNEPPEENLLVPFESQNLSPYYKEYYIAKRQNLFACIQGFPVIWEYYVRLDKIWFREFEDLNPPPRDPNKLFPLIVFFNSHAKMRVSIELALSGCMAEARSILRDAVECVAHAHRMLSDPKLQITWLSKNDGRLEEKAFKKAFGDNKRKGLFKGLDELYEKWGELSETGSHTTLNSMCDRFEIVKKPDGSQDWRLNYCGVEQRTWAMSLFSMLLTCYVMERTFFDDYASRLQLDYELMRMRSEFERYKEQLRKKLIVRYRIKPPQFGSIIYKP
jgi:hypothetical protein